MESEPFAGVVLCCTSIPVDLRTDLAKKVAELGGVHKNDLTHEVTHLIVGDYNTPKYRHVVYERPDIKPMCAGWVDAVLDLWTRDADIDFAALEEEWRLRTFEVHGGLPAAAGAGAGGGEGGPAAAAAAAAAAVERGRLLCSVTGFEEEDRQRVIATIVAHGGVYSGDLTRAVTHLIVNKPEGKKYNAALQWGIKTVAIEWLDDCAARGMILDEARYDPRLPKEERGKGARSWVRAPAERAAVVLGKRLRDAAAASAAAEKQGQRKLRKTASQKLTAQRDNLWGHILGKPGGGPMEVSLPAPDAEGAEPKQQQQQQQQQQQEAIQQRQPEPQVQTAVPTAPAGSTTEISNKAAPIPAPARAQPPPTIETGDVLYTCVFCIFGFSVARTEVLANAVATMGGTIASNLNEMASIASSQPSRSRQHVIVPQDQHPVLHPAVPDGVLLVTEFFIEQCLHKKRYALPEDVDNNRGNGDLSSDGFGVIGRPFPVFPIPGFEGLSICTSGFTGVDLNQVDKAVRQLGAKYEERFTAQCSVLAVTALPAVRKQKLELALAWKVPVVDARWLWACVHSGTLVAVDHFLFPQLRQQPSNILRGAAASKPATSKTAQVAQQQAEPTMGLTVPTLVVPSPQTLFVTPRAPSSSPAEEDKGERKANDDNDNAEWDGTAPFDTAPTHAGDADTVRTKTVGRAVAAAVEDPISTASSRHPSVPPPPPPLQRARPSELNRSVSPPKQENRPPPRQQPQQPRKPLSRVVSEIADSAAGDSDDPVESDDTGGGGSYEPAQRRGLSREESAKSDRDPGPKPRPALPPPQRTAPIKRSATSATSTSNGGASASTRAKQRPALSRVVSEGLADIAHVPVPIGISIGDLMKDGGAAAKGTTAAGDAARQQHQQQQQQPQRTGLASRTLSSASAVSVPGRHAAGLDGKLPGTSAVAVGVPGSSLGEPEDDAADLPPTQVQVQYLDPEGEMYREQLMRKILGGGDAPAGSDTVQAGDRIGIAAAAATINSAEERPAEAAAGRTTRRSSRLR